MKLKLIEMAILVKFDSQLYKTTFDWGLGIYSLNRTRYIAWTETSLKVL